MDDGGKLDYNKNSSNKGVVLNTQSFEAKEVKAMLEQLSEKFNLDCEIRSNKGKKIIVIKSSSYSTFLSLIDPYILPEMRYKLPLNLIGRKKRKNKDDDIVWVISREMKVEV